MNRTCVVVLSTLVVMSRATAGPSTEPSRFILLTPFHDYGFFIPIKKGMQDAASAVGVTAVFDGVPDGNVRALAGKVTQAVADGYDGIALNIVDPDALDAAIIEAGKRGVPVIAFNVDDAHTPNARLSFVGQNMLDAGRQFGRYILESIPEHASVLLTMHDPNISALEDRARGIQEILNSREVKWTSLITGTDREQAVRKIKAALDANPNINIVLGTGSADTEAAGLALERHFRDGARFSAGFDISSDILRLIKRGVIRFTVDQQPYAQGYLSVMMLALYKRTRAIPASVDTGATFITRDTVEQIEALTSQHIR